MILYYCNSVVVSRESRGKMLSKISIVILGLVAERPMNPYEILRYLNIMQIRRWFPISDSAVYTNVRKLAKSGLIVGETIKEGNMPAKKVYSITDKGMVELRVMIDQLLAGHHIDYVSFNLGITFTAVVGVDSIIDSVKHRLDHLKDYEMEMTRKKKIIVEHGLSDSVSIAQKRNASLIKQEIIVAKEYLDIITSPGFKAVKITDDLDSLEELFSED